MRGRRWNEPPTELLLAHAPASARRGNDSLACAEEAGRSGINSGRACRSVPFNLPGLGTDYALRDAWALAEEFATKVSVALTGGGGGAAVTVSTSLADRPVPASTPEILAVPSLTPVQIPLFGSTVATAGVSLE